MWGQKAALSLPVKNINVGEVHEERMGCVDQKAREAMVGVSGRPLGAPSPPSTPIPLSPSKPQNRMGTFPKLTPLWPLQVELSLLRMLVGGEEGEKEE